MTVFVYISRRPKVFNRPKKRLYNPPRPSNLSWKIPLRRRWQPRRYLSRVLYLRDRRRRLLYSIAGPPASFAPTKRAFRIRIKRGKRFVKTPKLYSIAGLPARFVAAPPRRRLRLHSRPMARFFRPRSRGVILPVPPLLFLPRRRLRLKRRVLRTRPRLYPVMAAPAGFAPGINRRVLQLHSTPLKAFFRPRRRAVILPSAIVLFRKPPRLRIKRGRRFVKLPRLYSIAGPPIGFIATKRMWRVRIKRGRRFVKASRYPIVKPLLVLFRKLPRLKIKRGRRFTMMRRYPVMDAPAGFAPFISERTLQLHSRPLARFFRPRRVFIGAAPVGFIAFKKPPRAKIKRMRLRIRPRVYPIVPALLVMYRALRRLKIKRAHLRVRPRTYSIAGPPVGFIAFKKPPRAKIKRFRIRLRPRSYPIVTAILVLYRALRRLKIKRGRRFIAFPRRYSIAGPPTGFIAFKKPPRAKVRRGKIDIRRFIKRFFVPFVPLPPIPPIVLPPAGGGKRKKTAQQLEQERRNAALVEKAKQALSPGDQARAKIAAKLKVVPRQAPPLPQIVKPRIIAPRTSKPKYEALNITPEEMLALLNALQELDDDDDED